MKSYPSAFVVEKSVGTGILGLNLEQNINNYIYSNLPGMGSAASMEKLGERINTDDYDPEFAIKSSTMTAEGEIRDVNYNIRNIQGAMVYPNTPFFRDANVSKQIEHRLTMYENPFKISSAIIRAVNKYRKVKKEAFLEIAEGTLTARKKTDETNAQLSDSDERYQEFEVAASHESLFNPFYGVNAQGINEWTPMMNARYELIGSSLNENDYILKQLANQTPPDPNDPNQNKSNRSNAEYDENGNLRQVYVNDSSENPNKVIRGYTMKYTPNGVDGSNSVESGDAQFQRERAEEKARVNKENKLENMGGEYNVALADMDISDTDMAKIKALEEGKNNGMKKTVKENGSWEMENYISFSSDDITDRVINDFSDCTIKTLVNLSRGRGSDPKGKRNQRLGRGTYRWADFMFCRDLGKIPNNHLITLRRFSSPIHDNIFKRVNGPFGSYPYNVADRGHLVTWFGTEENKLEDICKYSVSSSWREMNSKIQDVDVPNTEGEHMGASILNLLDPSYWNMVRNGTAGSENILLGRFCAGSNWFSNKGSYETPQFHRDANKVWEPKNTIQSTHLYEGKIQFSHEFSITFAYEMKHYDGINGKSAFLDLVGQILRVCHNEGSFWGGAINFHGKGHTPGWHKMNKMLDALEKGAQSVIDELFGISSWEELGEWCKNVLNSAVEMIQGAWEKVKEMYHDGTLKAKFKGLAEGALKMGIGMMKNKLGRPAAVATDSLLSGAAVGLWHVTIGNPRAPIMTIGNLILTNAEIQHYGPLGIDDFPTKLKVTVTLKHGMPRDINRVSSMYTLGDGGTLMRLSAKQLRQYYNISTDDDTIADLGFADELYEIEQGRKTAEGYAKLDKDMMNMIWSNLM